MKTTENKTDTTPTAAKPTGIKKLNLGGITQKSEKSGKEYPALPDLDEQVDPIQLFSSANPVVTSGVRGYFTACLMRSE